MKKERKKEKKEREIERARERESEGGTHNYTKENIQKALKIHNFYLFPMVIKLMNLTN